MKRKTNYRVGTCDNEVKYFSKQKKCQFLNRKMLPVQANLPCLENGQSSLLTRPILSPPYFHIFPPNRTLHKNLSYMLVYTNSTYFNVLPLNTPVPATLSETLPRKNMHFFFKHDMIKMKYDEYLTSASVVN